MDNGINEGRTIDFMERQIDALDSILKLIAAYKNSEGLSGVTDAELKILEEYADNMRGMCGITIKLAKTIRAAAKEKEKAEAKPAEPPAKEKPKKKRALKAKEKAKPTADAGDDADDMDFLE
jgi:hypothetical protein